MTDALTHLTHLPTQSVVADRYVSSETKGVRGNREEKASVSVSASVLDALAHRLAGLRPDWNHPERFYEQRSELAAELRRLARDWRAA